VDKLLIHFGIETEYGITRDDAEDLDVVAESIALVRSALAPGVRMKWDYAAEDPHADVRGFKVEELRQDYDESNYFAQDAQRELTFAEIKSDLALSNGARFYNDHAHPEYCTPECSTLDELAAHDRAGEQIVMDCAERLSAERGATVRIYKNNTDFRGHSYGCHENYLLPRSLSWERLVHSIEAFMLTHQIFAGAGKFAAEGEDKLLASNFQISQRSDFFTVRQSVDTMQKRPLINTRDEPHANPADWRRFHVILGDANMSPFATRLKVGTLALVLEALIRNPDLEPPELVAPVDTLKSISRDPNFQWFLTLKDRSGSNAIDVQRRYLDAVRESCVLDHADASWTVTEWERVLNDLEADPLRCRDRVDWVAKHALITEFQKSQGLAPDDPWVQSLDLEYHRLDLESGLYFGLEQSGSIRSIPNPATARAAQKEPPDTTRAFIRGRCIGKFPEQVLAAQWDHVVLQGEQQEIKISLLDLFAPADVLHYRSCIEKAETPDEFRFLLNHKSE
jgi:proteasome accessory factor A